MSDIPILFLVFNRPDVTAKVFQVISEVSPKRLYVAADGPRKEVNGETDRVTAVRDIVTNVNWDCEVKTLFRDANLGCKNAVSGAIDWFFAHEEEGVILEDDCLPDKSFFYFCDELLARYRDDSRVMMISGDNYQEGKVWTKYSYYFSRYTHIWGWATWKRAWKYWDGELSMWPEIKESGLLKNMGGVAFEEYWSERFDKCYSGEIDTWDYPWLYSCWIQNALAILPNENLVSNIGFGEGSTHTNKITNSSNVPRKQFIKTIYHPPYMIRNIKGDSYTDEKHYFIKPRNSVDKNQANTIQSRVLSKIRRIGRRIG